MDKKEKLGLLKQVESTLEDQEHIKKLKREDIKLLKRGVGELKILEFREKMKNLILFTTILLVCGIGVMCYAFNSGGYHNATIVICVLFIIGLLILGLQFKLREEYSDIL